MAHINIPEGSVLVHETVEKIVAVIREVLYFFFSNSSSGFKDSSAKLFSLTSVRVTCQETSRGNLLKADGSKWHGHFCTEFPNGVSQMKREHNLGHAVHLLLVWMPEQAASQTLIFIIYMVTNFHACSVQKQPRRTTET